MTVFAAALDALFADADLARDVVYTAEGGAPALVRAILRRPDDVTGFGEGRLNSRGLGVASRSKTGRGRTTVPIFLLVPQVKLPKRLDLDRDAERALDSVPRLIAANWVERRLSS